MGSGFCVELPTRNANHCYKDDDFDCNPAAKKTTNLATADLTVARQGKTNSAKAVVISTAEGPVSTSKLSKRVRVPPPLNTSRANERDEAKKRKAGIRFDVKRGIRDDRTVETEGGRYEDKNQENHAPPNEWQKEDHIALIGMQRDLIRTVLGPLGQHRQTVAGHQGATPTQDRPNRELLGVDVFPVEDDCEWHS